MDLMSLLRHVDRLPEVARCLKESPTWKEMIGGYLGFAKPHYPFDFETRREHRIRIETLHDLKTAWVIYFRREYEVPSDCKVILDVGANIGTFSIYAAEKAPEAKIYALEPFPQTLLRLKRTVSDNQLDPRLAVRGVALAAKTGIVQMDASEDVPSQSRGMAAEGNDQATRVQGQTLGDFLAQEKLDRVDLFKIDIEGAEHEVFAQTPESVLQQIRSVAMEYHPNGEKIDLFKKLKSAGFRLHRDLEYQPNSGVAQFFREE